MFRKQHLQHRFIRHYSVAGAMANRGANARAVAADLLCYTLGSLSPAANQSE